jgi:AraC-like DNA-binding protein
VLSLVVRERPDFYLAANISVNRLYMDILSTYELNRNNEEFFFITPEGKLLEGTCDYMDPNELLTLPSKPIENNVSFISHNRRIYFLTDPGCGIYCVTSYPTKEAYQEAEYLGKYVFFVCLGVLFFLLIMSGYMAKRLYHPINALYTDIEENAATLHRENTYDEIDMLKHVFAEMNAFNSLARQNLKQFDEISKIFQFRNFLEHSQCKADFLSDHPYLFNPDGSGCCELLMIKYDIIDLKLSREEEMVFRLNLQEVLLTYLQSSMKGILTRIENDNLVLLYHGNDVESITQTRKVLTDTVIKLSELNAYFAVSEPITSAEEILSQYQSCQEIVETSYFFSWRNELITSSTLSKGMDLELLQDMLLRVNTSLIRSIVSQKQHEIEQILRQLEQSLRQLPNASQARELCNQMVLELDHEFHFNKALGINLLPSLQDKKSLTELLSHVRSLLIQLSGQFSNNDARENNYCELAEKYLDENYMRDMNITDVADYLDISYSYLSKIFRTIKGITLTDHLNKVRIEKSKEYLENTFLTLNEIAEKVGYNNVQSYQRFFKKYMNITPGDYRRLHSL